MTRPWLQDADVTLWHGDVLAVLPDLPAESVDCVVTSPPYWGLRDYGTGGWSGGDPECDHAVRVDPKIESSTLGGGKATTGHQREGFKDSCPRCGATRIDRQLGLEPTPEQYVERMVEVFREIRRVLAPHGTVWLNLGDSYAHSLRQSGTAHAGEKQNTNAGSMREGFKPLPVGLKEKDLVGVPWRVAFALQADGWYLRSDIIWAKKNCMPESVTDRPTKAHEYVFLLSKNAKYHFDQEAVRESHATPLHSPGNKRSDNWQEVRGAHVGKGMSGHLAEPDRTWGNVNGRNIRSVWEIATQPFSGRELFGGTGRIPSPDCPVHGVRRRQASEAQDDGQRDASDSRHSERTDSRLEPELAGAPSSTSQDRDEDLVDESAAIRRSSETSRTDAPSAQRDSDDVLRTDRSSYTSGLFDPVATSVRTPESKTEAGSGEDARDFDPSVETPSRTARKACTCKYIDHFAVFPEELARRCIAAGCPEQVCRVCGKARERVVERILASYGSPRYKGHGTSIRNDVERAGNFDGAGAKTLGFTDCGHADYRCGECGIVINSCDYADSSVTVPELYGDQGSDREAGSSEALLLAEVRERVDGETPSEHEGLLHRREGLSADQEAGPSAGIQERLRDGAPTGDGTGARATFSGGRDRASQEREQGGQPPEELGSDAEAPTRPQAEATEEADHLPPLRGNDHRLGPCPSCGGRLERAPDHERFRPGVTLDPFIGSGTVAYVARKLGRHSIGIDLNSSYLKLAARRLQQQSLFALTETAQ